MSRVPEAGEVVAVTPAEFRERCAALLHDLEHVDVVQAAAAALEYGRRNLATQRKLDDLAALYDEADVVDRIDALLEDGHA